LDKATGGMQQRSLASGLNISHDDSTVIACTDNVLGLEYLFRAETIRDQGLTFPLRGYQHIALLKWRSLQPTWQEPWDRLCDALNGSGVYSAQEALSALKIQPVSEALRATITASTLEALVSLSRKSETTISEAPRQAAAKKTKGTKPPSDAASPLKVEADAAATPQPIESDPRLKTFFANADLFQQRILQHLDISTDASTDREPVNQKAPALQNRIAASVKLPALASALPKVFQRAATIALPSLLPTASTPQSWGPLVLWLMLESLATHVSPLEAFDSLNLRPVVAEAFAALGLEGEAAWRAAAQVAIQLKFASSDQPSSFLTSEKFWRDPDVRWLAGVNRSGSTEYVNQESFEALLCWIEVPALLQAAASSQTGDKVETIAAELANFSTLLKPSGYEYESFISAATDTTRKLAPGPISPTPRPTPVS